MIMGVSATCEKWQAKCELPVSERIEGGGSASSSSSEDPGIYLLTYLLTYPGGIGGVGVRPPAELPPAGGSKPTPLEESCVSVVAERWRLEATAGAAQYAILEYAQDAHSVAAERADFAGPRAQNGGGCSGGGTSGAERRWFEFNDRQVKLFDPADIADAAFGGEEEVVIEEADIWGEVSKVANVIAKTRNAFLLIYDRCTAAPRALAAGATQPLCQELRLPAAQGDADAPGGLEVQQPESKGAEGQGGEGRLMQPVLVPHSLPLSAPRQPQLPPSSPLQQPRQLQPRNGLSPVLVRQPVRWAATVPPRLFREVWADSRQFCERLHTMRPDFFRFLHRVVDLPPADSWPPQRDAGQRRLESKLGDRCKVFARQKGKWFAATVTHADTDAGQYQLTTESGDKLTAPAELVLPEDVAAPTPKSGASFTVPHPPPTIHAPHSSPRPGHASLPVMPYEASLPLPNPAPSVPHHPPTRCRTYNYSTTPGNIDHPPPVGINNRLANNNRPENWSTTGRQMVDPKWSTNCRPICRSLFRSTTGVLIRRPQIAFRNTEAALSQTHNFH